MTIAQVKIKQALDSCNRKEFRFTDCVIGGDECCLVNPVAFPKWTQTTKYLRSLIYRKYDYTPISVGFPKFVNAGENPIVFPVPTSLDGCTVVEKKDGSLLIVSKHNSQLINRTRGSIGVDACLNKDEISIFKDKYPLVFDNKFRNSSLLFEWTSPLNRIVIDYGSEPELTLIGCISHSDLTLLTQDALIDTGKQINVQTPQIYKFDSLDDLITQIKGFKNKEGACLYSKDGQEIFKFKSDDYLIKHRFKSNLNYENMVDYFLIRTDLSIETILDDIEREVDFECATQARIFLKEISDRYGRLRLLIDSMRKELAPIKDGSRKELALFIQRRYNATERRLAFQVADGKEIDIKLITNILNERTI